MTEGLKRKDDRGSPSLAERTLMGVSVAFTLALFAYVAWQAYTSPAEAVPEVRILGTQAQRDGTVKVDVEVLNRGGVGLIEVEVEVTCGDDPPTISFQHVPADGRRQGIVFCPAGTTDPKAEVVWWTEA